VAVKPVGLGAAEVGGVGCEPVEAEDTEQDPDSSRDISRPERFLEDSARGRHLLCSGSNSSSSATAPVCTA
jgi:hypothetical protein